VQAHNNVPFYQNLISKANANPTYYLASNLNYSVTKKRLIMMTKTPQPREVLSKRTSNPCFNSNRFRFCTKVVAQEKRQQKRLLKKPLSILKTITKTILK
jgi:hypothetical protein